MNLPYAVVARGIGVSEKQVARWRSGQEPTWRSVERIAEFFGRSPEWFYVEHEPVEAAA